MVDHLHVSMRRISDGCPLQYIGSVNGVPFYYRERHEYWEIGISWNENHVDVAEGVRPGFRRTGVGTAEDSLLAERRIFACCQEYVEEAG